MLICDECRYWRTTYAEQGWAAFLKRQAQLSLRDLVCMVDDAFALANVDLLPPSLPLRLVSAVAPRADYPLWVTSITHLRAWSRLLATAPPPNAIRTLVARIMPQVTRDLQHSPPLFARDLTTFHS